MSRSSLTHDRHAIHASASWPFGATWRPRARPRGRWLVSALHALLATVWRDDQPMVTIGIATHSRAGASLWRALGENAGTPIQPLDCPAEPWVVARLEPAIVTASRDVVGALGDLERCLGWAWIERPNPARTSPAGP